MSADQTDAKTTPEAPVLASDRKLATLIHALAWPGLVTSTGLLSVAVYFFTNPNDDGWDVLAAAILAIVGVLIGIPALNGLLLARFGVRREGDTRSAARLITGLILAALAALGAAGVVLKFVASV